jgi:hypothetical protein
MDKYINPEFFNRKGRKDLRKERKEFDIKML